MRCHIRFQDVSVSYGKKPALRDISLEIPEKQIFGIIGPANSGKTTLLKCINRTIDFVPSARVTGQVLVGDQNVFDLGNVYGPDGFYMYNGAPPAIIGTEYTHRWNNTGAGDSPATWRMQPRRRGRGGNGDQVGRLTFQVRIVPRRHKEEVSV